MTDRWRHNTFRRPIPTLDPLISQAEMVYRIEVARLQEAPACCPTCRSTTPDVTRLKWCGRCQTMKPIVQFARNRGEHDGRQSQCRECHRGRKRGRRSQSPLFEMGVAS
jgi:hypothetical protein